MNAIMPPTEWNATERTYPDVLLHEAFAAQAARTPSAPAVRFRDEALTYAELDKRIAAVASRRLASGLARG